MQNTGELNLIAAVPRINFNTGKSITVAMGTARTACRLVDAGTHGPVRPRRHVDGPPIAASDVLIRSSVPALPAPHVIAVPSMARHGQARYRIVDRPAWVAAWANPPKVSAGRVHVLRFALRAGIAFVTPLVIHGVDPLSSWAPRPTVPARPTVGAFCDAHFCALIRGSALPCPVDRDLGLTQGPRPQTLSCPAQPGLHAPRA